MTDTASSTAFATARRAMIDSQLRPGGINAPFVLDRMGTVPREDFVPDAARGYCYMDRSVPLGDGNVLPAPQAHGALLREARPRPEDRALIVGDPSGYLAALLGPLVASVATATPRDAATGKATGEYDLVLVDGAIEHGPAALAQLVAAEGRVVTGLVQGGVVRLANGRRNGDDLALMSVEDVALPRLPAFARPKEWSF